MWGNKLLGHMMFYFEFLRGWGLMWVNSHPDYTFVCCSNRGFIQTKLPEQFPLVPWWASNSHTYHLHNDLPDMGIWLCTFKSKRKWLAVRRVQSPGATAISSLLFNFLTKAMAGWLSMIPLLGQTVSYSGLTHMITRRRMAITSSKNETLWSVSFLLAF